MGSIWVRTFFRGSLLLFFLIGGLLHGDDISPTLTLPVSGERYFPPAKLRAYGTLSAEQKFIPGQPQSSVMSITCDDVPKAQLVLAKYLSDLGLLPGVNPLPIDTALGKVAAREIDSQGAIAAARVGIKVWIFTAADGPSLSKLIESSLPAGTKLAATEAEIQVPMYVDRWDKYGFRFYYSDFWNPQDVLKHDLPGYDTSQDFTFAKQSGDAGLVVWNTPVGTPYADGIMNINSRQWVFDAAKKNGLPLGINIGLEDHDPSMTNRYPSEMAPNADSFLGGWYGAMNWGGVTPAWSDTRIQDLTLGELQPLVRKLNANYPNIVNWLEPHEEMGHGICDFLDDRGPGAVESFHTYLKGKYGSPEGVAKQWSVPGKFTKWDDIPLPELATFLNWNSQAIDLAGIWKFSLDAPYGADSAKPDLDDSTWDDIPAPGHGIAREFRGKPAVFRRHFKIDPAWRTAHTQTWLYLWDLNDTRSGGDDPKASVYVFLNGQAIPETDTQKMGEHYCALDISSALKDGDNVLTVCLPQGMIDYRCYLSAAAPQTYPALGPTMNAQWADFTDWISWSRGQAVRRGAEMIRQVDPDKPITMMAPGSYLSDLKKVAEDYGGILHDTGGMAGSWGDAWPNMAQSSGLPTDCEPGNGAPTLEGGEGFKSFMGRWSTEGTQGIDYFQHLGEVMWRDDIRDYFTKTLPLWHLMGKYHVPQAELAVLNSDRNMRLLGAPWDAARDPNKVFADQRWWSLISNLLNDYPRAGVVENDFALGNADQFRVVLDGNTTIMDPPVVDAIEKWVRAGGTFITFQQTGRHTSVQPDSWPIAKLTGYAVTGIDKLAANGDGRPSRMLHVIEGQRVFNPSEPGFLYVEHGQGLSLKKIDPNCEDLLQWNDGSIAAGMRHLGKGLVVDLGTNSFQAAQQVLEYLRVKRVEGSTGVREVMTRHFISNNGLYDVWVLYNTQDHPATVTLTFTSGVKPDFCRDVNTGQNVDLTYDDNVPKLKDVQLEENQTRAFISPRGQLANAPSEWLTLQRGWWRGTEGGGKPIVPYQSKLAVNLTDDMAFKPIDGTITAGTTPPADPSLADPKLDDSTWPRRILGVFDIPDYPGIHHGIFRKSFTIPAEWTAGQIMLSAGSWAGPTGGSRTYIDGQECGSGQINDKFGSTFTPGSKHMLAIEVWDPVPRVGPRDPVFLYYHPHPLARQPIKDSWAFAADKLKYDAPQPLPRTESVQGAWRTVVKIDASHRGQNILVHTVTNNNHQHTLLFNGRPLLGNGNFDVNVTPYVKFGQENEIIIVCDDATMTDASIDYYNPVDYP